MKNQSIPLRAGLLFAIIILINLFSLSAQAESASVNRGERLGDQGCLAGQFIKPDDAAKNAGQGYYLYPYNLHLTAGAVSGERLVVKDSTGAVVSGNLYFYGYNHSLISIDSLGYVHALRTEEDLEIGTWVQGIFKGNYLDNSCVVRVLSTDYGLSYTEVVGNRTILCYPTTINGENIETYVTQYQIPLIDEYAYDLESSLMGLEPFNGIRQIIEVDFGESESQRVCGISGNPFRLGWNIKGNEWQNCFLVPFISPRSPQWFILYHEIGHNFTWPSIIFGQGLGPVVHYSEGVASIIALEAMQRILDHPVRYPHGSSADNSLRFVDDMQRTNFSSNFQTWLDNGANFADLDANIVDGIWLRYRALGGETFARRFFLPLQPRFQPDMQPILDMINGYPSDRKHILFAALVSAAIGEDSSATFADSYHYPITQSIFDFMYQKVLAIMDSSDYLCGDADGSDQVDVSDAVYLVGYIFGEGGAPDPLESGDADCDGRITISDAVYLVNYIFGDGAIPCAECR
jgi:hypothetical protein